MSYKIRRLRSVNRWCEKFQFRIKEMVPIFMQTTAPFELLDFLTTFLIVELRPSLSDDGHCKA